MTQSINKISYKPLIIILFSFALCFSSSILHTSIHNRYNLSSADKLQYLPSGTFLKGLALSYDNVLADLLWIRSIGYFADEYVTTKNYSWLYHILDITTTLDPYYQDPYEFGGIILTNEAEAVEKSSKLLRKGMQNVPKTNPRYWYLPFFLSYNYWYYSDDYKEAARLLEIASHFPQSPSYLPLLTARMYANSSSSELAIPFLDEMIKQAQDEKRVEQLQLRKKHILVNTHLEQLNKAVEQFNKQTGRYPNYSDEIIDQGLLKKIPEEPFGGSYYYDFITKTYLSDKTAPIKLHERKKW